MNGGKGTQSPAKQRANPMPLKPAKRFCFTPTARGFPSKGGVLRSLPAVRAAAGLDVGLVCGALLGSGVPGAGGGTRPRSGTRLAPAARAGAAAPPRARGAGRGAKLRERAAAGQPGRVPEPGRSGAGAAPYRCARSGSSRSRPSWGGWAAAPRRCRRRRGSLQRPRGGPCGRRKHPQPRWQDSGGAPPAPPRVWPLAAPLPPLTCWAVPPSRPGRGRRRR